MHILISGDAERIMPGVPFRDSGRKINQRSGIFLNKMLYDPVGSDH